MHHLLSAKTACAAIFALFALFAAPAFAAEEHQIILELELDGASCPSQLVTISAQSCDEADLATELEDKLDVAGFTGPISSFCAFSFPDDEYQCVWSPPAGCTQVNERAVLETGTTCADTILGGRISRPISFGAGFFTFDVEP